MGDEADSPVPPRREGFPPRLLLGLGAVRLRPEMYIGDTQDGTGLHSMVLAAVNAALRERHMGRADHVAVTLNADGSCTIADNGPGLSGESVFPGGMSEIEAVLTRLDGPDASGFGEHAPLSVVNALSHWLRLETRHGGKAYDWEFRHGAALTLLAVRDAESGRHGTRISFRPSADIFARRTFERGLLTSCLAALSRTSGVRIDLADGRPAGGA